MYNGQSLYPGMTQNFGQFVLVSLKIIQLGAGYHQGVIAQKVLMKAGIGEGNAIGHQQQVCSIKERGAGRDKS